MKLFVIINLIGLALLVSCGKSDSNSTDKNDENQSENSDLEPGMRDIHDKVIYGDDDRKDLYQLEDSKLKKLTASTVALMKNSNLILQSNGDYKVSDQSFGQSMQLCPQEPFFNQTNAAFCSGSLVAEDLVLTAGHCIQDSTDCSNTSLVFGYAAKDANDKVSGVKGNDVYHCAKVIKQVLESNGTDFTIIQLDRKVAGRMPLPVRRQGVVTVGDNLTVIGHPSGLPVKVAGGGVVRSVNEKYFVTNLDTYGGNSGSAVFNTVSGDIEGVLVRGDSDFTSSGGCYVSRRCSFDGCRGEDVTRASQFVSYLPESSVGPTPTTLPNLKETFTLKPNLKIPDANTRGVETAMQVNKTASGRKVTVTVNVSHTYIGDLVLKLVDPSGKSYLLQNKKGGRTRDLRGTFGKELTSETNLQSLSNASSGVWKLQIADVVRIDTGTLLEWSVNFE